MNNPIDHTALKNEYAAELAREMRWVDVAKELLNAARLMEPLIVERESDYLANAFGDTEHPIGQDFRPIYFMIVAYACENLLKAAVVRLSTNDLQSLAQTNGLLPKSLKSHDLYELAVAVDLDPSEGQELLLRRLTWNAVWSGRYPVPLKAIDWYGDTKMSNGKNRLVAFFNSDDVLSAKEIVSWLESSLRLPLSETTASKALCAENMERTAKEYDLKTCPLCGSREALVIQWFPDIDPHVHEMTAVGCKKCDKFFSEKKDMHAIAAWNYFVIQQDDRIGKNENHVELYRLLYAHSQAEKQTAFL